VSATILQPGGSTLGVVDPQMIQGLELVCYMCRRWKWIGARGCRLPMGQGQGSGGPCSMSTGNTFGLQERNSFSTASD
jgi:hypothetical protein